MNSAVLCRPAIPERTLTQKLAVVGWAVVLGLSSGLACVGVRVAFRALQWLFVQHTGALPEAAALLPPERRLLTPALGSVCAMAVLWAARRWSQAGPFEEYVEAVRRGRGHIPFASTLWRTISAAFSVATGAAIGREGSMIQFAAAVTSWIGERAPVGFVSVSRQVAYGAAAAVASVYQAPFAGVFFAMEIVLGEWAWTDMPQLVLSSLAGWQVSRMLLGAGPLFIVSDALSLSWQALWALPLALITGLCGPAYQFLLRSSRRTMRWPCALLWSALPVGLLSLLAPCVWGNGDVALLKTIGGQLSLASVAVLLILRLVATAFCVGTGTAGGVFTPTLFAGAALGLAMGLFLHIPQPVLLAVIGLSSLLAAVTHAPFMATLMGVELTGQWRLLPVLLLLNLLAWQVARTLSPHSLYAIATPASTEEVDAEYLNGPDRQGKRT